MPPVEFEPTISAGERPQTYALDRAATGTFHARYKFQSNTTTYYIKNIFMATCFDSVESSSGLPKNRSNVSKFIVHSGIPNAYNIVL